MASKKGKKKSSGSGGCCPVIKVRCGRRKYGRDTPANAQPPPIEQRLAAFKALKKAATSHAGPKGSLGGWKDIVPGKTLEALKKAGNVASRCTVSVGGRHWKGMNAAQATQKVAALVAAQKKRRCSPLVQRD